MGYKLFIDDERDPPNDGTEWVVVRNSKHACHWVAYYGLPDFISFDHDLGGDDTSMKFLQWLANDCLEDGREFTFGYYVHSQNPIGKANIEGFIESFKNR